MRGPHLRSAIKSVVAILCAACFLTMSLGSVSPGFAADTMETWPKKTTVPDVAPKWETWPNKTTVPGVAPNPEMDAVGAAKAGEAAGKKTVKGISSGTIWWIAAGTAVLIGIAIAAGGGGGGGGGSTNPGHQ